MFSNVIEQRSAFAHHPKQSTSTRIIAGRTSHMLGHSIDSFRQHGNLHIWRTIIAIMCAELADNFLFSIFCNGHVKRNSHLLATTASGIPRGLDFTNGRRMLPPFSSIATAIPPNLRLEWGLLIRPAHPPPFELRSTRTHFRRSLCFSLIPFSNSIALAVCPF